MEGENSFVDVHDTEAQHSVPVPVGCVPDTDMARKGRRFKKPAGFQGSEAEWAQLSANERSATRKRLRRAQQAADARSGCATNSGSVSAAARQQPAGGSAAPSAATGGSSQPATGRSSAVRTIFRQPVPRGRTPGSSRLSAAPPGHSTYGMRGAGAEEGARSNIFGMDSDSDRDSDSDSDSDDDDAESYEACPPYVKNLARDLTARPSPRAPSKFELSKKWLYQSTPALDRLTANVDDFYCHKLIIWDPISVWSSLFPGNVLPCPRYMCTA